MLWTASAIKGYAIKASDGFIGSVADLRVQDSDWTINWLEVDTNGWLPRGRVLIPIASLGEPDPEAHQLPVSLTIEQIENSPDPQTGLPASKEMEAKFSAYYGLPRGRDSYIWGAADTTDDVTVLAIPKQTRAQRLGVADPEGHQDHLHSMTTIIGCSIEASDGDIGHAEDLLIDTTTWQVRYMTVHTSDWWVGEKVLISPGSIDWIDWARAIIHLSVSRQKVKESPPFVADQTVDGAYDATFNSYYGIRFSKR